MPFSALLILFTLSSGSISTATMTMDQCQMVKEKIEKTAEENKIARSNLIAVCVDIHQ